MPYCPNALTTSKKVAFTLAEVLITLGIIGVIAALTMPSLIQNYKKKEYSTRLKRFYSTMSQAVKLSEIDNDTVLNWDYANNLDKELTEPTEKFLKKYILPYIKQYELSDNENLDIGPLAEYKLISVKFSDGSIAYFKNGNCLDIYYDVNGKNPPNQQGRDIYTFALTMSGDYTYLKNAGKTFIAWGSYTNIKEKYENYDFQINACKTDSFACARALQMNNWEYPKDYPYKL